MWSTGGPPPAGRCCWSSANATTIGACRRGIWSRAKPTKPPRCAKSRKKPASSGRIVAPLGTLRYPITGRSGRPTTKVVTHFLVAALDPTAVPAPQPGEVDAVRWVPLAETATLLPWAGDQEMIALAEQKLTTETTESTE